MASNLGRPSKYPWDKWLARTKKAFALKQGKDYDCQSHCMRVMFYNKASREGLSCSIQVKPDCLYIKLTKEG